MRRLVDGCGHATRLFVEKESLLTEPGAELLPNEADFAERPSGLIVGEDGVGGPLLWIAAAVKQGVSVYVVPYEFSGRKQIDNAILPEIEDHAVKGLGSWLFGLAHPRWLGWVDGRFVFRLPLRYAKAYEEAGIAPPLPWTVHGGRGTTLLSESPRMTRHYRREGLPARKIVEVGSLALDDLARELTKAPKRGDKLRLLCALPPDYTVQRGPMPYADLISRWVSETNKHGTVTLQAHPAARALLASMGYQTDTRDITALIANCDVLVTSVSSIIRLALAAGKPVLNFDCYRFDYEDYRDAAGCVTVTDEAEFKTTLKQMVRNFSRFGTAAVSDSSRWGALDGKAGERIVKALGLWQNADRAIAQASQ